MDMEDASGVVWVFEAGDSCGDSLTSLAITASAPDPGFNAFTEDNSNGFTFGTVTLTLSLNSLPGFNSFRKSMSAWNFSAIASATLLYGSHLTFAWAAGS